MIQLIGIKIHHDKHYNRRRQNHQSELHIRIHALLMALMIHAVLIRSIHNIPLIILIMLEPEFNTGSQTTAINRFIFLTPLATRTAKSRLIAHTDVRCKLTI